MTTKELYKIIATERPLVIYVTGKTSTGKTTFAEQLEKDLQYKTIILDQIVVDTIVKPLRVKDDEEIFLDVYRTGHNPRWTTQFVEATRSVLAQALADSKPIVVEGALARNEVLIAIFRDFPNFQFVYFHPDNLETYQRYLTSRFKTTSQHDKAGLPGSFWELVDNQAFVAFCKSRRMNNSLHRAIQRYALLSQQQSLKRLHMFQQAFDKIVVVNP